MSFCAELTEKNTKRLAFKVFFSSLIMIISMVVYPQASAFSPYETIVPNDNSVDISVYLTADSINSTENDLSDMAESGVQNVIIMPNMESLSVTNLSHIINVSSDLGMDIGISIGGSLISNHSYMSDEYQNDITNITLELTQTNDPESIFVLELLPFINMADMYGTDAEIDENADSTDLGSMTSVIFGETIDHILFLEELISDIGNSGFNTGTNIHISYITGFRSTLRRLGEIPDLDQIGVGMFQPHINALPSSVLNGIRHAQRITGKNIVASPLGFSTHDDAHTEKMQDAWFWNCLDVASSVGVSEMAMWKWNDEGELPFSLDETIKSKYGIEGKSILNSITSYSDSGKKNLIGKFISITEIILGTFSVSGSTGMLSGNIIISLIARILIGILLGRKCKINGKLLGILVFGATMIFHISLGAAIVNTSNWWIIFPSYFYIYSGFLSGIFQIQVISAIVRHNRVYDFCETDDVEKCTSDFFQIE